MFALQNFFFSLVFVKTSHLSLFLSVFMWKKNIEFAPRLEQNEKEEMEGRLILGTIPQQVLILSFIESYNHLIEAT